MIAKAKQDWFDNVYSPALRRTPERDAPFETSSGNPVEPLYTAEDRPEPDASLPGEFPYTRGIQPTMYRGRLWTMRQYAGFGDAEESNKRFRYLIDQGQTGLSVAFDLPTQIGYDADHPLAEGEAGKVGVSICSLEDMETLFKDIPLEKVTTSMTINATAAVLLALYVAVAKRQGADLKKLGGTVQNDILKEYVARGTYIYPPRPSLRLITDLFAWCQAELPEWNTISISGYHMREAGCTAAQEVAFTLANAIEYVQAASGAGLSLDEFAPRLSFFFACHSLFFEEAAKFRAARRLWARLMKERFSPQDPRSMMLRFHTQTGGATLTAQQPENNIVRTALEALAAVLGGTQSLHTNSYDEALSLPSEHAVTLALRTQQVIAFESGVADTVDPLAGSYYVEKLTDQVEAEARAYIEQIDAMGGALAGIERGFQQHEIAESAFRLQRAVEEKRRIVVGVNQFREQEERPEPAVYRVDPAIGRRQAERLHALRARRDEKAVAAALARVSRAGASTQNLMPPILEAVESYATLGEICDVLRAVWGEQRQFVGV